jgi:hypothetical protein
MIILGCFYFLMTEGLMAPVMASVVLVSDVPWSGKVCGPENDHYRAIRRNQTISFHCSWPQDFGRTPRQFRGSWNGGGVRTFSVLLAESWMGKPMENIGKGVTPYFRKHLFVYTVAWCFLSWKQFSHQWINLERIWSPLSTGYRNCWPPGATVLQCPERSCIELCARI